MNLQPKISIVIPVYNTADYLEVCLTSIIQQSLQELEVICVDDCSTDSSWDILQKFAQQDRRFKVVKMEKNSGSGLARNKGIELAEGKYVAFCDSDDAYPKRALETLYEHAELCQADLAAGNLLPYDNSLTHLLPIQNLLLAMHIHEDSVSTGLSNSALWMPFFHPRFIFKLKFVKRHNIKYPNYLRGQDPPFLAKILCANPKVALTPASVYHYRYTPKNRLPTQEIWYEYLAHIKEEINIFLEAGQPRCACLYFFATADAWQNWRAWLSIDKNMQNKAIATIAELLKLVEAQDLDEKKFYPYHVQAKKIEDDAKKLIKHGPKYYICTKVLAMLKKELARYWKKISAK